MGASRSNLQEVEAARRRDWLVGGGPVHGAAGMGFQRADGSIRAGSTADQINGARYLYEIYATAKRDFSGRVTVPVLWDKQRHTIVNNESSEVIRMLNSAFDEFGDASLDFYPPDLRTEIDHINPIVYHNINNGVYKCGFASTQEPYDVAFNALFQRLDEIEELLGKRRYIAGDRITEADWRLFTTLVRFDSVYYVHFKCNLRLISSYPNLWNYTRELYQVPGVGETVNLAQIKRHYYTSHPGINPSGIIADGPAIDFKAPHDRDRRYR
jgi:putative glutathione S-transferase